MGETNCSTATGTTTNAARYQIASGDTGSELRVVVTASYSGHPDASVQSALAGEVGGATWPSSYTDGPLGTNELLPKENGGLLLGMWPIVNDQGNTTITERALITGRIADMGRTQDLLLFQCDSSCSLGSGSYDLGSSDLTENWFHSLGAIPYVTWQPDGTYAQIAAGTEDAEIDSFASRFHTFGHRVMLRLFSEFNDPGFGPWSATDFIAAWRHVVTRVQSDGATNVGFVFCPEERAAVSQGATDADVDRWATFATVAGGAAAGLTGLLFVAVSIRIDVIAKSRELRNRAAQTLPLFVTVLFIAILLSIPDRSVRVLGVELVALAVITGGGMLVLDRRARVGPDTRDATAHAVASILDAVAPNAITSILLGSAGLLLVFGAHAGLDVLVVPVLVALAGGVTSAWLLLTKIPE